MGQYRVYGAQCGKRRNSGRNPQCFRQRAMLEERGLLMRQGMIIDATIIAAPPSTKNKSKTRDPEMHQPRRATSGILGWKTTDQ